MVCWVMCLLLLGRYSGELMCWMFVVWLFSMCVVLVGRFWM